MSALYYFISWVRSGVAALITGPELGKQVPPGAPSRVSIPMTLHLNGQAVNNGVTTQLYGPGDVVGIDAREIIRTGPLPQTPDYAPEKFAFIEFDRPDFPWMFTPAAQDKNCLRPWIVLVVVEKNKATITPSTSSTLPILCCPITELPHLKNESGRLLTDLNESWAWAHAQYTGDLSGKDIVTKLDEDPPDRNLSRLLCLRKLAPYSSYVACLVPAFEAGRKAGLGVPFDPDKEPLAHWTFRADDEVKLPVYYHWEFSTGEEDHFIELAEKIQPLTKEELAHAQTGLIQDMDLSNPGNGMGEFKNLPNPTLPIPSALRIMPDPLPPGTVPPPRPETPKPIKDKLNDLLTTLQDTVIPPPTYGSWHAPPPEPSIQLDSHLWLKTLNLEPRYRVVAALGTCVIQQEQEHLVAAAWEQVADLQRVNRYLQQKQLGCSTTDSIHKNRLTPLSTPVFAQITERLFLAEQDKRDSSPLSTSPSLTSQGTENSPQFRRMTRGGGPWAITGRLQAYDPDRIAPPPGATEGAKQVSGYRPLEIQRPQGRSNSTSARSTDTTASLRQALLRRTEPKTSFQQEVRHRVRLPGTTHHPKYFRSSNREEDNFQQHGPLGPYTYSPSFPQPMYEPLRDQFPDRLLPGLEKIPNDRAALLETDAQFIEAYLVGLNHEMSREFLWREFPTMLHTTYFQQFWDVRGAIDPQQGDIPKLREWAKNLGENVAKGRGGDLTFLLIRGGLILRYPNALIYAHKKGSTLTADHLYPSLRISIISGVVLLGFNVTKVQDWRFFVEEHFTEPYFGPKMNSQIHNNTYVSYLQLQEEGTPLAEDSATVAQEILHARYYRELKVTM